MLLNAKGLLLFVDGEPTATGKELATPLLGPGAVAPLARAQGWTAVAPPGSRRRPRRHLPPPDGLCGAARRPGVSDAAERFAAARGTTAYAARPSSAVRGEVRRLTAGRAGDGGATDGVPHATLREASTGEPTNTGRRGRLRPPVAPAAPRPAGPTSSHPPVPTSPDFPSTGHS